jgi:hypothetical protein
VVSVRKYAVGLESVTTNVLSSGAAMPSCVESPSVPLRNCSAPRIELNRLALRDAVAGVSTRFHDHAKSRAVSGVPSAH